MTSCVRLREPSSKVEQTVNALKEEQKQSEQDSKSASSGDSSKEGSKSPAPVVKRPLSKRVWDELVHYYHGFRLLFIDIRIASRLVYGVLNGKELSRREYRQLSRTTADIFRLVPFSIFIIVPFMGFLLPVFLKFFPGMLPSTFMSAKDKESKIKQQLKVKLDMTKFLQTTLDEMALTAKGTEHHSESAKEFSEFFRQIRQSGEIVSNESILKFSKLFEDEITLDSLSRPQLIALCRLLELKPIGPNYVLRFQLRTQLRSLKSDDVMIQKEGVNTLTVPELQQACRSRGMRALGVAEDRLRTQLAQWLELSLNEKIPPSLLLLSRILYLPENIPAADQLKATIQALPVEVGTEAKYKIGETEGKIDNKTRLELIRQEEAAIRLEKEEAANEAKAKAEAVSQAAATPDREILTDSAQTIVDRAIVMDSPPPPAKDEKAGELSPEDLDKIEQVLDQITKDTKSMAVEKEELEDIKEEMADYKEDIQEFQEIAKLTGKQQLVESSAAKSLRKRVDKMINKMDTVMHDLESKKEKIQEKLQVLPNDQEETLKSEKENLVNINEILTGIRQIQSVEDEAKMKTIIDVLDTMDVDHDGKIDVEHVVNVIELLGRENVNVSSDQMKDIIKLLIREDQEKEKEKSEKTEKNPESSANNNHSNNNATPASSSSSQATNSPK
jgi:LETM1 and EF-hand domain-containing protein 1